MAEAEQNKTTPTPQRRHYHQSRPNYSHRGRGRIDPHVSKALHNFGVTDLREWLDKKHQQEEQTNKSGGPPPDPSYNYLKDPLRENTGYADRKHYKDHPERSNDSWSKSHAPRGSRGRRGGLSREDRHSESETTAYIQNPINIKVELTTATGERIYQLDEETKLADIKHVPDLKQQARRSFRGERGRGGYEGGRGGYESGRGRYESGKGEHESGRGGYENRKGRYESGRGGYESGRGGYESARGGYESGRGSYEGGRGRSQNVRGRGDTGRGRGDRGRGRGRGGRGHGRGRGQGRYNPNRSQEQESSGNLAQNTPATEVPTEENWDDECAESVPENVENKADNLEETHLEDQEAYHEEVEAHEDYDEAEEYLEVAEEDDEINLAEHNEPQPPEGEPETGLVLEENLVITSSVPEKSEESGKRTVRFKLDNEEVQKATEPSDTGKSEEKLAKQDEENLKSKKVEEKVVSEKPQSSENELRSDVKETVEGDKDEGNGN